MNKLLLLALIGGAAYWLRSESGKKIRGPSPARVTDGRSADAGRQAELDDALRGSFPASDPVSLTSPHP